MSQGTSRLLQFGGGAVGLIFMPIMIIIALVFASLSNLEEAQACSSIQVGEPAKFVYPVANHDGQETMLQLRRVVIFPAESDEDVHAVAAGRITSISGNEVTIKVDEEQTPRPTDGSGDLNVTLGGFTEVTVHEGDHVTANQIIGKASGQLIMSVLVDGHDSNPKDFLEDHSQQAGGGSGSCGCGSGSATGSNNEQKAFNYFVSVGYNKEWAAGIVGNMVHESGVDPKKLNGGAVVSSANVDLDGRAWGVVQWYHPRKMIEPSRQHGFTTEQIDSLEYQLEFVWRQLEGTSISASLPEVGDRLKRTTTVEDAAFVFARYYEVFTLDETDPEFDDRRAEARRILNQYGGSAPASGTGGGSSCTGTAISIDGVNYAFPFVRPKNDINNGYRWPCSGTCHHDNTPAFDLARRPLDDSTTGTPVVAITNGHIERLNNAYADIEGCQSFQLVGDDGWWYWYGHLSNASVRDGQTVTAGQAIAQVGQRACTGNGSYPHLHIDRGSPKGNNGGDKCCRDMGFVDLINRLYAALPDAS